MKKVLFLLFAIAFSILQHISYSQSIGAGEYHTLLVCSSGSVKACGPNWDGEIGDGTYNAALSPVQTGSLTAGFTAVAGGAYFSLGLKSDGTVWSWGYNGYGQLGDNTTNENTTPVQVSGLTGVIAISAGRYHSLALKSNGTVWAWGYNSNGQLGDGTTAQRTTPVQVVGLTGITNIAAGMYHSIARKNNGTVWAWGNNGSGQLGDGTTTQRLTPVQTITLTGITDVSAGANHSLARKSDGTGWAWGYNGYGQLGDGTYSNSSTPVQILGLSGITKVSCGVYHSFAVKNNGTAWAWGNNGDGQLGDGTSNGSTSAVQVSGLAGVTAISGGYYHSVALLNNGTFWAWGYNGDAQLGIGNYNSSYFPLQIHDCCSNLPLITFSAACTKMDTTVTGGTYQKTFKIFNSGCSSLTVTSISSNNSVFTVNPTSVTIPSYDSASIDLAFAPTALGDTSGTITILNNDNDTSVCISGYCVPAPTFTSSPVSFDVPLACNDASTEVLTIGNNGPGVLQYDLGISASSTGASFFDGFESGDISSWNIGSGIYTRTVVTTSPASGTYCLQLNSSSVSSYDGVNHSFPSSQPSYIAFKIKSGGGSSSCAVEVGRSSDLIANGSLAQVWMDNSSLQLDFWTPYNSISTPLVIGQWYQVEFRNIDYVSKTFDYYINGSLISSGLSFWNTALSAVDVIHLFSWDNNSTSYFDDIILGTDPYIWLSCLPTSGTVSPSGSQNVNVTFSSANLYAGTYYGNIEIKTNDPSNLKVFVRCTLTVAGPPIISFSSPCLNYGNAIIGATYMDSVLVSNTGCDTLKITSIICSPSSVYTVTPTNGDIPPGESGYAKVIFAPTSAVSYPGTVTFHSNLPDETVCLSGTGIPAPVIFINPTSFNVTRSCCDTLTLPLTIQNNGGSDLINQLSGGGKKLKVALVAAEVASNETDVQTKLISTGLFTAVDIIDVQSITPTLTQLQAYDAVLVWRNYGFSNASLLGDRLADYVDGGGGVVTAIFGNSSSYISGRFNSGNYWCINPSSETYSSVATLGTIYLPSHPILKNVLSFNGGPESFRPASSNINPSATRIVDWSDGKPLVATRVINGTNRVDLGMFPPSSDQNSGFWNSSTDGKWIMANALAYSANSSTSWLTLTPKADTIAPGNSAIVDVRFISCGLTAGTYTTNIVVNSNDPANPTDSLPVTYTVVGSPKISFNTTCLNFGSAIVGTSIMDSVKVTNTGCDTLKISSIVCSPAADYTATPTIGNIPPGQSGYVKITFAPIASASYTGTVTFHGNVNDTTVCLNGSGIAPLPITVPLAAGNANSLAICSVCEDEFAWGYNSNGQLGDGTTTNRLTPVLSKITGVSAVASGYAHSLALKNTGSVWSWGYNGYGQLGDGTYTQRTTPVQVTGLTGVNIAVAGGYYQSLALRSNGTVWAWGYNGYGQLGDGTTTQRNTPVQVSGLTNVTAIASGYYSSYALKSDSTVWAWGYNGNGQIGDGSYSSRYTPVQVTGLTGIVAIASGYYHALAIKKDGTVWAWGYNGYGQLGDGTTTQSPTPVQVSTLTGITAIAGGQYHSIALKSDGTVWAWGYNGNGQIGDGTYSYRYTPVQVSSLTGVVTGIAAGPNHSLVIKNNGSVWAWGYNGNGQLGDGTTNGSNAPVQSKNICPPKLLDIDIPLSSPCTKYDTLIFGFTDPKSFKVYNRGCDTLRISSVTLSPAGEFTVLSFPAKVAPVDSGTIIISLTPTGTGTVTTTATVYNNDADTSFCLKGVVIPAPVIAYAPASLSYTLACCNTGTLSIQVDNNGGSNLISQFTGGERKIKVALVNADAGYVSDVKTKLLNTGKFTAVDIIAAQSSTPTLAQLQTYDAVLVWSNNGFNNPTVLGNNLADYVDAGGGVVVAVFADASIPLAGRFAAGNAYYCINPSGQTNTSVSLGTIFQPNHPILKGVTSLSGTNMYHQSSTSINSSATRIANWSDGTALVATRVINGTHRVDLGMWPPSNDIYGGQWLPSTDGALLMANALMYSANASVSWMTLNPKADTIAPGGSATVTATFNSCGLIAGTYTTIITIASNDPASPKDTIPVNLEVIGTADFQLAGLGDTVAPMCLNLDTIMDHSTSTDTVYIGNTGCDTLFLDSIKFTPSEFSLGVYTPYILPGDTGGFVVLFSPISTGTFTGTASVFTNDIDTTICLQGIAYPRPTQVHIPASYSITIGCNDTIFDTLIVRNDGGSNLEYTLEGSSSKKLKIALIGADYTNYTADVKAKLMNTGRFSLIDIYQANSMTPSLAQLMNYDAVLVWGNYGFSNPTLLGDNLADYVDAGGGVVTGVFANTTSTPIYGRFNTSNYWCLVPSGSVTSSVSLGTIYFPNHQILKNISSLNGGTNAYRPSSFSVSAGATRVADWSDGRPFIATKKINGTNRVDLGMWPASNDVQPGNWLPSTDGAQLMANALFYTVYGNGADWITINPAGDTIAGGDSTIVAVNFSSTNLIAGTYTASITIYSNDPLNPIDTIPVTLNVVGTSHFQFAGLSDTISPLCLNLDSIMESTTSSDTVYFTNTGCDTLFVDSVKFSPAVFSLGNYSPYILPGDTGGFVVLFSPISTATFTGTASLYTNDKDSVFCLKGKSFAKPVQCHNPNSFYEHFLVCQDSILDTLTVCNTGLGNLNYNLWSPYGRSLSVNGTNQYVNAGGWSPGSKWTIEAWVKPSSLPSGRHTIAGAMGGCYDWGIVMENGIFGIGIRPGGCSQTITSGVTAVIGNWYHIVGTSDGYTAKIYVNGVQMNSGTVDPNYIGYTGGTWIGGESCCGNYFPGNIDEVRIWNYPLTQSQIDASMTTALTGTQSGLVGYWNFDDSTATDLSINTNNGTMINGAYITVPNIQFVPAATGTVTTSGTYTVQVKFKKAGLAAGTYTMPIFLNSNDPLNTVDTIFATVDIDALPPSPTAGSNSPICGGNDLSLTASTISGASYAWTGPNSFTSTLQNPVITGASTASTGTYSVTAAVSGCPPGAPGTTTVTVNPPPATPVPGSNTPVCSGQTLLLNANTISGAAYSWTGPNSFTSTLQNPTIAAATTNATGTYSVIAIVPGCAPTSAGTTTVIINQTPVAPSASSNTPVCAGNDLSLTASTIPGVTYSWTGPNSFTSTDQNPVITGAVVAGSGTYSVTATENSCTGPKGITSVTVNPQPSAPTPGSNSTVCSGLTLLLNANTIASATYSWSGPNSYTSSIQNPSIPGISTNDAGTYSVTATVPGCPTSPVGTTTVAINQTPATPLAGSNTPVCVGNDLSLTASTISNVTYAWAGPNSFTSTDQNPVITGAVVAGTGTYSVTSTENGCTSPKGITSVTVNPQPSAPTPGSNSTVCSGNVLSLTANTIASASYSWSGPNSYTSSIQNPSIPGISTNDAGTYSVTATVPGCPTSPVGTATVAINQTPSAPTAGSNSPVCSGNTLSLTATTTSIGTYLWNGPSSYTSTVQDPTIAAVTTSKAGTYSVSVTEGGCPSPAGTVSVTIYQTPSAPTIGSNSPICTGYTLFLNAISVPGATYSWNGPNSFTDATQSPSIASVTSANAGTYSVVASFNGCPGPAGTTTVVVNDVPSSPIAGSNTPVCSGQTLSLTASVSGATYSWSGPNSFTSTLQNPNITLSATINSGTYSVTASVGGCPPSLPGTAVVIVNQTPSAPVAGSNSPICSGTNLSLTANATNGISYTWSGPNSFTDATQNPTITGVSTSEAGTYSVTSSANGCTGLVGTTSVVINLPATVPTAGNNSTVCSGQTLNLTASSDPGVSYSWSGPNSFTSTAQNPSIAGVTTAANGTYSVTATSTGCNPSAEGTTTAVINQTPSAPVASSNSPVCSGFALSLTASTAGTSYSWSGPASFTSTDQDPILATPAVTNSGTYSVTATELGCTGTAGTTSVVVNAIPPVPVSGDRNACANGIIPPLVAVGTNIQWYDASMNLVYSGSSYATGQTAVGTYTYYATQTVNGCTSPTTTVLLTINPLPAPPNAGSDVAICLGDPSPTLNATGTKISWYDGSGNALSTSNPYTIGTFTAAGTYSFIATQSNTVTTCESLGDTVVVTINSTPPPVAPDVAVCAGNPVPDLVATSTDTTGGAIKWYNSLMTFVHSGSTYATTQSVVGTYTYYVSQTNAITTCVSPLDTVLLFISTQPTLAPTVTDQVSCAGSTIPDLTATTGTIINWYSDAALNNHVFTGNPFASGQTAAGTYTFFATDSTPGCPEGPSAPVTLTINPRPATPVVSDSAVCFGSTVPNLIFNGTDVQWYNASMSLVFTGDTFATGQTAAAIYTYYVSQTNTVTTCVSLKDTVHLIIHSLPAKPTALDTAVCSAAAVPNLTANGTNLQWYNSSGTHVFTGNSYATGQTAPGTYTYYVTQKNPITGCESVADTSVLSIMLSPPVPVANNVAVCTGNPIPWLSSTGSNVHWYNNAALTNLIHIGNTYNTLQTVPGVYTYWVTDSLTGCVSSSADSVTLTISSPPIKPIANNATLCYGAIPMLNSSGTNPHWFSDPTLINMVGTGNGFNTGVTAVGTYTYYVTDYAAGCGNSISDTAVLTINPNPLVTANTYSTTILQNTSTVLTAYNASSYVWQPGGQITASITASPTVTTTYTVTGTNQYNCSSTATVLVLVNPLGVIEFGTALQDVSIYPNPAKDAFTIEFNTTLQTPIDIYLVNMLGERVPAPTLKGGNTNSTLQGGGQGGLVKYKFQINTSTFTEGIYNVEIVTELGTVNKRVVLFR